MRVTLHEVAARADVSIATVSRALNGLPVSADSLERVQKAASELGYVANAAARALRAERTMTLGMIFYDMQYVIDISLVDALTETVEAAGYSLLISTARGDPARYEILARRFLERRVDGLFCFRPRGDATILTACEAAGVPLLTLYPDPGPYGAAATVRPRFRTGAIALADRLYELGHRRMLVVSLGTQARIFATVARAAEARGFLVETVSSPEEDISGLAEGLAAGRASVMLRWLSGEPPEPVSSVENATFEERGTTGPARR